MFILAWYSLTTTIFHAMQSDVFIFDCEAFISTLAEWMIHNRKTVVQISNGISNPIIAGIVYWLIMILIVGVCMADVGILAAVIYLGD